MRQFFKQLRRRRVIHTAIAYLVAAYAAVEAALVIAGIYELPTVWVRYLATALGIGFVPVVILSWYYQWSSGRLQRDHAEAGLAERGGLREADYVTGTLLVIALAYISWDLVSDSETGYELTQLYPLTTAPGVGAFPYVSHDGNYVAYAGRYVGGQGGDIFVQGIDSVEPVRLTETEHRETSPAFSPDGTQVAFIRLIEGEGREIVIKPKLGGAERVVYTTEWESFALGLDWSLDGQFLLFPASSGDSDQNGGLYRYSLATDEMTLLTKSGSYLPRTSPDGQHVAFHAPAPEGNMLCIVRFDGTDESCFKKTGHWNIWYHDWLPDSETLVFIAEDEPDTNVRMFRQVDTRTGEARPFHDMPTISDVSIAKQADRVVLVNWTLDQSIWRIRGPLAETAGPAEQVTMSKQSERWPDVSPDGSTVVFWTDQSGTGVPEFWTINIDGTGQRLLLVDANNYPRFSPDGNQIAYTGSAYVDAETEKGEVPIDVIDSSGGVPRRVIDAGALPTWSADGDSIYYINWHIRENCPEHHYGLMRQSLSGGGPILVHECGHRPIEGPDGRLYFVSQHHDNFQLFSVPLEGGTPRLEVEKVNAFMWDLSDRHLVYIDEADQNRLKVREVATGETRTWAEPYAQGGVPGRTNTRSLSVSRDGSTIVFTIQAQETDFWKTTLIDTK